MKEGLRKLKGVSISTDIGDITLTDTFRQNDCEFDQLYYLTQQDSVTAKLYDLQKQQSAERFRHQQEAYLRQIYQEIAQPLCIKEIEVKKNKYGLVAIKTCKGSTLKEIANSFNYGDWLSLVETAIGFIQKLRAQKQVYLNFHPSNISRNLLGELKITDPQFLTSEGNYQQIEKDQQQFIEMCQKDYLYKPPQLLDQYIKGKIDYKSDLFAFATVLYEMLYKQYPFESKLAQISCNYRPFPQQSFFTAFISKIFLPYHQRQSLQSLKAMVEGERKKVPREPNLKSMSSGSTNQSKGGNIFSGLTQMFSKLTTQTEGWYLNYTQNDNSIPEQKYLNQIVSKMYKKQAKLQKLQVVLIKYLQQGNLMSDQMRFVKTSVLMIQLLRRGQGVATYQWDQILQLMESKGCGNAVIVQLCQFFRQKLMISSKLKGVFRGNFYVDDFSKFKLVSVQMIGQLQVYLNWVLTSIKGKLLFLKKDEQLIEYIKEVYCDQILDLISTIIFSIVSLRKDNELKLRIDSLEAVKELQKKLNGFLQRISYISNHVNGHGIYSLQADYIYYQEQIPLKDQPYFTSLQHFYHHTQQYKGLCVPQNYSLTYSSGDQKNFFSGENNKSQKNVKEKQYFLNDDEQERNQTSFKIIEAPPSPQKIRLQQKFLQQLKPTKKQSKSSIESPGQSNTKSLKTTKKQQIKKTVNFDQFFRVDANSSKTNLPKPQVSQKKAQFLDFSQPMDKKGSQKKDSSKKAEDFAFFDAFFAKQKPKQTSLVQKELKQGSKPVSSFDQFFQNFQKFKEQGKKKEQDKKSLKEQDKKPPLSGSSSQKVIQDSLNVQMKKSVIVPMQSSPQKAKPKIDSELLQTILSGLRLKELKDVIVQNQDVIIGFEKLKLQKVIGSGSAGEVYFGRFENEVLAIKKVKTKENPNALKEFERQLLTYIKMKRNRYLVSLVGLSKSGEDYYLLTQFCNAGSLFDLLHKKANSLMLSWKQRIDLAIQIAKGMLALHQMKPPIIHRDLKSLNVFVIEKNGMYTAKVADFGLSRSPQSEMMTMYLGTLHWMAPELLDNKQYSIKVDIYSFGVVLWEICARKTPYNELSSPMAIIKHVTIEKKRPNMSLIPGDCPEDLLLVMRKCWSHEPSERPSFQQIIDKLQKIVLF